MKNLMYVLALVLFCMISVAAVASAKSKSKPKSDNGRFTIMKKEIDLTNSPILFEDNFRNNDFEKNWQVKSGEWKVKDGWCYGKYPENAPGMIVSLHDYFGDVCVEFDAQNVLPSNHDINVMWNGSWNEKLNKRDVAYVAGLQGWWEGKVGIEKSPEYKLNAGTPLFNYKPGKIYHVVAGSVDGHCFICVDGKVILEVTDPEPINSKKYGKVGFEAYCSSIRLTNVKVRKIKWKPIEMHYEPNF